MTFQPSRRILLWFIVVVSTTFSTPAPTTVIAQNAKQTTQPERIRFSFSGAPWRSVVEWLAKSGEYALHVNDLPLGSFTYSDDRLYTHDEAISRINMFLIPQRYTLVRSESLLSVISLVDENSLRQLDVIAQLVTVDELANLGSHEFVKCLFPLGDIAAEHAVEELSSLMLVREPAVLRNTNQLLVMDTAGKLRTVSKVLTALATPDAAAGPIRRFPLSSLDPEQTLIQIRPHVGLDPLAMTGPDVSLSIDKDRHQLLASGSNENLQAVANIILLLQETEVSEAQDGELIFRTHDVLEVEIQTVVNVLETLLAEEDVRLATNIRSNQLAVRATEHVHEIIDETIRELSGTADTMVFKAIDVAGIDAHYAAIVMNDMFASRNAASDGEAAPTELLRIDADSASGRLFVRARKSQIEEIERALQQLSQSSGAASSKLRVLPYRGTNARTLLDSAQKFWPHNDSIEIIPSSGDDADAKPLEREIDSQPLRPPKPPRQGSSSDTVTRTVNDKAPDRSRDAELLVNETDSTVKSKAHLPTVMVATTDQNENRSTESIGVQPTGADATPRIRVQLTPRGMLIHSEDPDALKRFEEHLKLITGTNAEADRQLAVFYLKHAEIDDANTLLRQLLSEDSLSADGSPAGLARLSLPQSMMDVTGGLDNLWTYDSATVIPDKRLNRFFVYGVDADLTTIEDHLRVIDRENSIAHVNTHGTPRMITLYHARADAVATVIRDTYSGRIAATAKERTAAAAARNQNEPQRTAGNQRAEGARGNGSTAERVPPHGDGARMTMSVDLQSNSIIVTAPSQLADEVEKLARAIDTEGRQSVQIVPLNGLKSLQIQESLKSLFGNQIRQSTANPGVQRTGSSQK